jgi:hypothetical protein
LTEKGKGYAKAYHFRQAVTPSACSETTDGATIAVPPFTRLPQLTGRVGSARAAAPETWCEMKQKKQAEQTPRRDQTSNVKAMAATVAKGLEARSHQLTLVNLLDAIANDVDPAGAALNARNEAFRWSSELIDLAIAPLLEGGVK